MSKVKPFLRWAGGKTWLTKYMNDLIPNEFNDYYEPFVGGGSMFLYLKSEGIIKGKSYLSDSNFELINAYRIVKKDPLGLINILKNYKNTEKEYYKMRAIIFDNDLENAARFIYLNKTSFNGIYRVNKNGIYNVPYGYRNTKDLFEFENLLKVSDLFKNTFFSVRDFKKSCTKAQKGDLFFLDPPYTVAHENNGFRHYNQSIFSWENQIQLSMLSKQLDEKEANFIITNAYHKSIKEIYTIGKQIPLIRASTIGGKGATRTNYKEIIITNIEK